jgi:hypothetical protein
MLRAVKQLENCFFISDLYKKVQSNIISGKRIQYNSYTRSVFQLKRYNLFIKFKIFNYLYDRRLKLVYLFQKLSKALYLMKSLCDSVGVPLLRNVYFTKFESELKYGIKMIVMQYFKYRKEVQDLLKESKTGSLVEICLAILRC